jgi:ribosomal protein S7
MDETKDIKENFPPVEKVEKVKKPRTEKQIEAFKKAQENRAKNILLKKEVGKKEFEEKILQKAISIKKKQINKQYDLTVLDQISDDETPIEEIKQKHRAVTPPPVRPLPQTIQTPIQSQDFKKTYTFL